MEKGTRVEQIADATRLLHAAGIEVGFFLQFGYPGETREDIERTLEMVRACRSRRHRRLGVVPAAGHHRSTSACRRSSGQKQNWVDSDDLAMMYHATYVPDFYRALHALVHAEFRAGKSKATDRAAASRARGRSAAGTLARPRISCTRAGRRRSCSGG